MNKNFAYRADLDGLRAVAVLSVLTFHAFPNVFQGGFTGVDVFFVISGYLISSILLKEIEHGTFSLLGFYRRRIARIFPALAVVLSACLLFGYFDMFDTELRQLSQHAMYGVLGFANISLWQDVGYFAARSELNPLLHLWSLGVEEQFYLVLPLLLLLTRGARHKRFFLLVLLFSVSLFLSVDKWQWFSRESKFYLPQFRGWELLVGVILAYREFAASPIWSRQSANLASIAGGGLVLASLLMASSSQAAWQASLPAVAGAGLLISAGRDAIVNKYVLSRTTLVYVGLVSYPLYLWHWPLLSIQRLLYPSSDNAGKILALLVAFALAVATWKFIERPIRLSQSRKSTMAALLVCMSLILTAAAFIYVQDGRVGWAKNMSELAFNRNVDSSEKKRQDCAQKYFGVPAWHGTFVDCSGVDSDKLASVVLVGNSHAHHLFSGVDSYYKKRGETILNLTIDGCALFGDPARSATCTNGYARIFAAIEGMPQVKTIILGEYVPYMTGNSRPGWAQDARTLAQRLSDKGKKLVFMIDNPSLDIDPRQDCYSRNFPKTAASELAMKCSIARSRYVERVSDYRSAAEQAIAGLDKVTIFDLAQHLCDADRCSGMVDGRVIYQDNNHFNYFGSIYVSTFFDWEAPILNSKVD